MSPQMKSYPRPERLRPDPERPFPIQSGLLPLRAPPTSLVSPEPVASRGRLQGWVRSTHLLPAAFPRITTPAQPTGNVLPEYLERWRAEHYGGRTESLCPRNEVLWTPTERWVRADGSMTRTGVTCVCTHPNGLHKETWDETLLHVLSIESSGRALVDEVWTLDSVNQGDGGLINRENLPDLFDWTEYGRDVVNFISAYLPSIPSATALPSILARVPEEEIIRRHVSGFTGRKVIGLGHSMGSTAIVLACEHSPQLFSGLILCDPILAAHASRATLHPGPVLRKALRRRDVWPNREEMHRTLSKSAFFQGWHPAVLRSYVDHGVYKPSPQSEEVRLKCTPYQEAASFSEERAPEYAWFNLEAIPVDIPMLWILSGKEPGAAGGEYTPETVWRRKENSKNVVVEDAGHLVVQEKPDVVATHISAFLRDHFGVIKAKI